MRNVSELSREELESIVDQIRDILWRDFDTKELDPEKEWTVETIEWVSGVLADAGLKPPARPELHTDSGPGLSVGSTAACGGESAGDDSAVSPVAAVRSALAAFIETIEATGGCNRNAGGLIAPAGDPDWTDLGDAYVRACTAIGRTPLIGAAKVEGEKTATGLPAKVVDREMEPVTWDQLAGRIALMTSEQLLEPVQPLADRVVLAALILKAGEEAPEDLITATGLRYQLDEIEDVGDGNGMAWYVCRS